MRSNQVVTVLVVVALVLVILWLFGIHPRFS